MVYALNMNSPTKHLINSACASSASGGPEVVNESWIAAGPLVRDLQGHIWLKGQRANKLLSQITFSKCKSNAHTLSMDVIFL